MLFIVGDVVVCFGVSEFGVGLDVVSIKIIVIKKGGLLLKGISF